MRIDHLMVKNFKGFENREFHFHPEFNLIVGMNGTGKTSLLEALSVATGSWLLGILGCATRHIRPDEVMLRHYEHQERGDTGQENISVQWEHAFPCEVTAQGCVQGQHLTWHRALNAPTGRTTYVKATKLKRLSQAADDEVRQGHDTPLPLIAFYGTERLSKESRSSMVADSEKLDSKDDMSRFAGYENSVNPNLSVAALTTWFAKQSWTTFLRKTRDPLGFRLVKQAMISCIENAQDLFFDTNFREVVVKFPSITQPFSNLSDGQRYMLAMVGDIALRAVRLNPHLGESLLQETRGVVLIDELDLHLHPRWQRRVIDDLRETFPSLQFICTSHSPFLIQSLHSNEELIMLDGQSASDLAHKSLEDIAQGIQQVEDPQVSRRYAKMKATAKSYLETLETAMMEPADKLEAFKRQLSSDLKPFAENPAFQAFLEMKRVAKLGS